MGRNTTREVKQMVSDWSIEHVGSLHHSELAVVKREKRSVCWVVMSWKVSM
jgi:hypothetical protein